jgi:beta-phosphoglucomutase
MIKAILMDFNGVIINDERLQLRVYQELLREKGIELTTENYLASLGMDDRTFVESAFARVGRAAEDGMIDEMIAAKSVKWKALVDDELPLFEGIGDFIEKMSRDFALGVVSMSGWNEIDFVLTKSGLGKFFSAVVCASDVSKCKPDPECFRIGFRKVDSARISQGHLPMTHSECLVIEDSPPGILAAKKADLPALGVANTVTAAELRAAGAGAVATDLRDWMPESVRLVFD